MNDRNRVLKQQEQMSKKTIACVNPIKEHDIYVSEIFDAVMKLKLENPYCFDQGVVNNKLKLTNRLLVKYGKDINDYYHFTTKEDKKIIGIRYKNSSNDICDTIFSSLKYKVILQVVIYEIDQGYFSELKSLVTYDRFTNELKIVNIVFSETLNNEKYVYCWSGNNKQENNKVFTKKIGN